MFFFIFLFFVVAVNAQQEEKEEEEEKVTVPIIYNDQKCPKLCNTELRCPNVTYSELDEKTLCNKYPCGLPSTLCNEADPLLPFLGCGVAACMEIPNDQLPSDCFYTIAESQQIDFERGCRFSTCRTLICTDKCPNPICKRIPVGCSLVNVPEVVQLDSGDFCPKFPCGLASCPWSAPKPGAQCDACQGSPISCTATYFEELTEDGCRQHPCCIDSEHRCPEPTCIGRLPCTQQMRDARTAGGCRLHFCCDEALDVQCAEPACDRAGYTRCETGMFELIDQQTGCLVHPCCLEVEMPCDAAQDDAAWHWCEPTRSNGTCTLDTSISGDNQCTRDSRACVYKCSEEEEEKEIMQNHNGVFHYQLHTLSDYDTLYYFLLDRFERSVEFRLQNSKLLNEFDAFVYFDFAEEALASNMTLTSIEELDIVSDVRLVSIRDSAKHILTSAARPMATTVASTGTSNTTNASNTNYLTLSTNSIFLAVIALQLNFQEIAFTR